MKSDAPGTTSNVMTREQIDQLVRRLRQDEVRNISILNFVQDNDVLAVERAGDSLLVRGRSDHIWNYVSSRRRDELEQLVANLPEDADHFAAVEDWMVPSLCRGRDMVWCLPMVRFVLPHEVPLPSIDGEVGTLVSSDAEHIFEHSKYRQFISVDYTRRCITAGETAAIRENGVLVAWAMTQDDGAMGFLQVLDAWQRRGYARRVTIALAAAVRQRRRRPFAYTASDNERALSILTGLGFVRDRSVQWFHLAA